ncbi:hypothetical protein OUZ56_006243 [Daphnia magna]|uniref:Uncharacterized protein n=1 Tax=Daphnia magna TaxID=35525 RepID=A0ABQ9YV45_9CRUS|nr:hypothetical protein OUZ56_006243 [Daphnia magna]
MLHDVQKRQVIATPKNIGFGLKLICEVRNRFIRLISGEVFAAEKCWFCPTLHNRMPSMYTCTTHPMI